MTNRARGRHQAKKGVVDKTIHPEPEGGFQAAARADCTPERYDMPGHRDDFHVMVRLDIDQRGRKAGFAVVLLHGPPEARFEVARIDTAHADVHLDLVDRDGSTVQKITLLKTLTCHDDVEKGYGQAVGIMTTMSHQALIGHLRGLGLE